MLELPNFTLLIRRQVGSCGFFLALLSEKYVLQAYEPFVIKPLSSNTEYTPFKKFSVKDIFRNSEKSRFALDVYII
jgi:hypothetical protein